MHRTPSHEDYPEQAPTSEMTQRRRRLAEQRRQTPVYYTDEHPEIPKIRRASLHTEQTPAVSAPTPKARTSRAASSSPSSPSRLPTTPRVVHTETMPTLSASKPSTASSMARTQGSRRQNDSPTRTPATGKISAAPARRGIVYEPRATGHPRVHAKRRQRAPLLIALQQLSHNQHVILVGSLVLIALILLPIFVTIALNTFSHPANSRAKMASSVRQSAMKAASPTDPHALVITPPNNDHPAPAVFAASAYLLDADTGATLYAQNPFTHLPMLSTTKLMTALLAAEQGGNLDRKVTITDAVDRDLATLSADSSRMSIKKGETYTLRELLYGLLLVSGNDAAIAIADAVSGNMQKFVDTMNQRAAQLGLHDTHYVNPHGLLDPSHFSSAHDLAVLGKYSLGNPIVHQISSAKQYHIEQTAEHSEHFLVNGDQFMWWYPGADAGKTGWDGAQNLVQVVSCTRNNHHLIAAVIHTVDWWTDMRDLMNWGFSNYTWLSPRDIDAQSPIPFDVDWNYFIRDKKENTVPIGNQGRYYIYTGYSVTGSFLTYFDKNGGLDKFGFPTGMPRNQADGRISQKFEKSTIKCDTQTNQCMAA